MTRVVPPWMALRVPVSKLSAVVVLAANLLTDIVYALVDPTIQY